MSTTLAVRRTRRTGEGDSQRKPDRTRPVLRPATDVPVLYREIATADAAIHSDAAGMQVSKPADPEEAEAERAADQIMRSAWETRGTESRELPPTRRAGGTPSGGEALRPQDRVFFEQHFGAELSEVRIHDNAMSARNARALAAHAFTAGPDISFGIGMYAPETSAGRRLLAHELAHVVQHTSRGASTVHRYVPEMLQREDAVPEQCPVREPDSDGVAAVIAAELRWGRGASYQVDELQTAWFHVRNQREVSSNCCNPELAAAEHYLYARYAVANEDYSPFEMKALVWGYGYVKFLVPKQGKCPKSPDTQGSRDWGYRGADDGARDLFAHNLASNEPALQDGDGGASAPGKTAEASV